MLRLENINIEFDNVIIQDSKLLIEDGKITALVGKSGFGKTSLLYQVGMICSSQRCDYTYDGDLINFNNDKQISYYKKRKIGYIFQENSLIDSLNILENFKVMGKLAGKALSEKEIKQYLGFVELDINIKDYPKVLSGGEQQRVAIACVLAKDPDIIIADEPTSALDTENSLLVMEILRKFVKQEGKKVLIASHNKSLFDESDNVYEIINKKLILKTNNQIQDFKDEKEKSLKLIKKLPFSFYTSFIMRAKNKYRTQRGVMLFLCAVSIAVAITAGSIGKGLVAYQNDLLNQISDREIYLVNLTAPIDTPRDIDENISINDNEYLRISEIKNIAKIYPFFEFRTTGYDIDKNIAFGMPNITVQKDRIEHEEVKSVLSEKQLDICIMPYYEEQELNNQLSSCFREYDSNAIYISDALAKLLGISNYDRNIKIKTDFGIPVATTDVELSVSNGSIGDADIDVSRMLTFDLSIYGIIDSGIQNTYSNSGNRIIYMPIEMMEEYLRTNQGSFKYNDVTNIRLNKWNPSALVIYADTYHSIEIILQKLRTINSNFIALNKYQNVNKMNSMINNIEVISSFVGAGILIIVFILMTVIYINYILSRKYETALLKVNGMTKCELFKLLYLEVLFQALSIIVLGIILINTFPYFVNYLFQLNLINIGVIDYILAVVLSLIATLLPSSISAMIINHINVEKILRN